LAWYAGTANLNESQFPSENGDTIYCRLGDLKQNNITDVTKTWYTPDHTNASFTHGNEKAPWEGIGTGWFDSVLGGGSQLRPYFDGGKKKKNELGDFEDYLKNNRVSVYEDNTYSASMRGDYAVPTLFNGNFDAVAAQLDSQPIPGWSLYNGDNKSVLQRSLVNRNSITTLSDPAASGSNLGQPNYALKLNSGESITHNRFVIPNEDILRLSVHVPEDQLAQARTLTISMQADVSGYETYKPMETIYLEKADNQDRFEVQDTRKINYGTEGFETFPVKIPESLRGKVGTLKFEVNSSTIYLDNIFFGDSTTPWKPLMTRAEAEDYTGTSYYRGKFFYHGTNLAGAESIATSGIDPGLFDEYATYGPGFYVGSNRNIAEEYAAQLSNGRVLDIMLKAKQPATFPYGVTFTQQASNYAFNNSIYDEEPTVAYTDFLKQQGIDSVEIAALQYFIVYAPEQVIVIES
jgi:hypothetical protein